MLNSTKTCCRATQTDIARDLKTAVMMLLRLRMDSTHREEEMAEVVLRTSQPKSTHGGNLNTDYWRQRGLSHKGMSQQKH